MNKQELEILNPADVGRQRDDECDCVLPHQSCPVCRKLAAEMEVGLPY